MSRKLKYYQSLNELVTNALLTLYSTMNQQGGFWSVKKRNALLVKYIKPKVKQRRFSVCKNELKAMLNIGRNAKGDLDKRLWEINALNLECLSKFSQADELYILLNDLLEQHQFPSMLYSPDKAIDEEVLYMNPKEVEGGFDDNNNQINPLSMTVKTSRLKALIEVVQEKGTYRVEVGHVDEHEVIHLLLHRKD